MVGGAERVPGRFAGGLVRAPQAVAVSGASAAQGGSPPNPRCTSLELRAFRGTVRRDRVSVCRTYVAAARRLNPDRHAGGLSRGPLASRVKDTVEFCIPKTEPFEKHSDAYDEWFEKNRDLYEAELEAIRQLIPPPEAEGMEVGIGSGKFAAPLGIKIGVEPSEKMAIKARKQGINVYPGIADDLPFTDGRFDVSSQYLGGNISSSVFLTTETQRTRRKNKKLCALRVSVVKITSDY